MSTADTLTEKKCTPCAGETEPMNADEAREYMPGVPGWELVEGEKIRRDFEFEDFAAARSWVDRVAGLADEEDHHPDLHWSYNKVTVELTTHKIGGLSENDFILAAKINEL